MRRTIRAIIAVVAGGIAAAHAAPPTAPYRLLENVAGPDGSYDYASVDAALKRVFVGRDYGVMIFDPATRRMRTLLKREGVAAVLPIARTPLMLSTNGDRNDATLLDRRSGAVKADIPTGKEPDGAYHDPATGLIFVMNGEGRSVTVIDVAHARADATIPVDGAPEGAVGDGKGHLFLNLEDRNRIAVIDIARRRIVAHYALPGCNEPTGITYDPASGLLISACHNRVAKLIAARDGRDRGTIPIGAGADGAIFDGVRRIGFIPCIDGTLTIFRLDAAGRATVLQTLRTREGARTAAYDSRTDRLYLPFATVERDARGEYLRARRKFGLLVVGRR